MRVIKRFARLKFIAWLIGLGLSSVLANEVLASETTTYEYDALGRLVEVDSSEVGVVSYTYDAAGNRTNVGEIVTNSFPIANNDTDDVQRYSTINVSVLLNDTDPDGDDLIITNAVPNNSKISVTISANSKALSVYGSAVGSASVDYSISDGRGGVDSARLFITVHRPGGAN